MGPETKIETPLVGQVTVTLVREADRVLGPGDTRFLFR